MDCPGASLILVCGPAGFGKTTLMRHAYAASSAQGASWVTLDEADNDERRFLFYLLAALGNPQKRSPRQGASDRFLKMVNSINADRALLQEYIGRLPAGYSLFLDDFETIQSESTLETVQHAIYALTPGVRVIIGSRHVPNLPRGRLRAHGQLVEVNPDSLRFTKEETEEFFQQQIGSQIDSTLVDHLQETTEGWITSLKLVALSLRNCSDSTAFIRDFSGSNTDLADYLAEDLLARQLREVREFLLKSSILGAMSAAVCDFVCQRNDSKAILARLERDNLFISVVDAKQGLYRYHNLFREFLQEQLAVYQPIEKTAELHKSAARWYEANQRPGAAVQHGLKSGDFALAGELIDQAMETAFYQGRLSTLKGWFDALPDAVLDRYPRMLVYYAWCLVWLHGSQTRIRHLLDRLTDQKLLGKLGPEARDEALIVAPLNLYWQDDIGDALAHCERDLSLQSPTSPFTVGVLQNIRAVCLVHLDRFDEASLAAKLAREAHDDSGSVYGQVYADSILGWIEFTQGRLHSALAISRGALELSMEEESDRNASVAVASAQLSMALFCANRIEEVNTLLDEFLQLINQMCMPDLVIEVNLIRARIDYQAEGYSPACRTLNRLRQIGHKRSHARVVASAWGEQARMAALQGDVPAAQRYLSLAKDSDTYNRYGRGLWFPTHLQLLLAQQRASEALPQVNRELRYAERHGKMRYALILRLVLTECFLQLKEQRKARRALLAAIQWGQKGGVLRPFIDASQQVHALIRECRAIYPEQVPQEFFEQLQPPATSDESVDKQEDQEALERLTKREFDVLKLLALGHSNQSICDSLFLSMATIKTHLRNINGKLGAKNRTEAVAIARRSHLLD